MEEIIVNPIKVSVCVSFYNAAKFVERCLDMLCSQTLEELEIVLVNDGSKDNTDELMRNYAGNHPERKFVLITQENGSLCQGRKTGVSNATGEYVTFLDQDDLIDNSAYEKMYKCAVNNMADIVEIQTKHGDTILGSPFVGLQDSHEVLRYYFTKGGIQSMLWMRMYKRTLFSKPVLPDLYTNNEDMYGFPCLLYAAHSIYYLSEPLHTYSVDNESSFMASLKDPARADKRFKSRVIALGAFEHFSEFVGREGMKEFDKEFNTYKATYLFGFLMSDFYNKKMQDKIDAIIKAIRTVSYKELRSFLNKWLPNNSISYKVYRHFGLSVSYVFCRIINVKR